MEELQIFYDLVIAHLFSSNSAGRNKKLYRQHKDPRLKFFMPVLEFRRWGDWRK